MLRAVLSTLGNGAAALSLGKVSNTALHSTTGPLYAGLQSFISSQPTSTSTDQPAAHLNWIFLDEQFNVDIANSGFLQVDPYNGNLQTLALPQKVVGKSGYLFVYVSNNTRLQVYFDNLSILHRSGPLLQESDTYAFGGGIDALESRSFGRAENKKGYNGNELQNKEFSDGSGLDLYDFNARTYDQQTGRFIQTDPMTDEGGQESWSPYHFSYNNPSRYSDPDGKIPIHLIIIGAKILIGAGIEYGSQVYDNYKAGKTGLDAWKPKGMGDVAKIALNGLTSAVDPSGGVGKKILITTATNVAESVGSQLLDGESPTFDKTLKDVAVMTVAGHAKVDGANAVNKLEKGADKLERVARNSVTSRNAVQAAEARLSANNAKILNEGASTATTETTESALGKKTEEISLFGNRGSSRLPNIKVPISDNTNFKIKQPVLPNQ